MREIADIERAEQTASGTYSEIRPTSIRVSPNSYLTAGLLGVFFSALLIYLEIDWAAVLLLGLSVLGLPALALTDRLAFDGRRLRRTGLLPKFWSLANGSGERLRLADIEQVETQAMRTLRRGGRVVYRYRTQLSGKGRRFVFLSGGEDYRRMIRRLFPRLSENVLDNRSIELRDYLAEPKEVLMKAEFARIPASQVLEEAVGMMDKTTARRRRADEATGPLERERAEYLRRLGNELRLTGHLWPAVEAFRRALLLQPGDGRLLFEAARCLHSFAGAERDRRMHRRSLALLRLAARCGADDRELLARIGEAFFQFGEPEMARRVFRRSIEHLGENFRSLRGMAEIALREGKIAHVIHNFTAANRLAETPALRRWTQTEADYFAHLNDDDEYMEMEISRINLLETLESSKKTALRIAVLGFPAILVGLALGEELVANLGWAVSAVALLIWTGLLVSLKLFAERIPYALVEAED